MFKALMRVQLASVIASLMRSSKGNEKRSTASVALIALLFVFVIGVLAFAVGITFYVLAVPLNEAGLAWFYFAMAALTAFALCFIGSVFTAPVVSITKFGAFVRILPGIDGLVHISEISNERVEKVSDVLKVGDEVKVKLLDVDFDKKRISLSMKALLNDEAEDAE